MADGDLVAVTPADLLTHAGHLDTIAAGLTTAYQAGQSVKADAGAYGKLCVMVPVMLGVLQSAILDGIDAGAGSVTDSAAKVRTAAGAYQSTDQASADDLARHRTHGG